MTIQTSKDPAEQFKGASGGILVSPLGTPFPTTIDALLAGPNAAWVDLGLATDAGPRFSYGVTVKKTMSWQEFYATREDITDRPTKVEVDLQQFNEESIGLGLGGAVVHSAGTGIGIVPAGVTFKDERQLIVYATDGDRTIAQCFRRVLNTKEFAFAHPREDISTLPLGFDLMSPPVSGGGSVPTWVGSGDAYFWLANVTYGS